MPEEWGTSKFSQTDEGKEVEMISTYHNFWAKIEKYKNIMVPSVQLLCKVDGEIMQPIAHVYDGINEVKVEIAKAWDNEASSYQKYWEIIDEK